MALKPLFNPAVSIFPLDTDSNQEVTLCEVPKGEATSRYAIPAVLVDFLRSFDGMRELEEAITVYQRLHPEKYSADQLEKLVNSFFLPKGLLIDPQNPSLPTDNVSTRKSFLYLKLRLVPAKIVDRVTPFLSWLFNRWVFIAWLPVIIATHLIFYLWVVPSHPFNLNDLTGVQVISIMLLATIPAFIHEWGHASAFTHYGCKKAEIGWGLYLYFFVFYTDVSEAWKLNRKQRAMIDVAGIYFQSFSLVVILLLYWWLEWPLLLFCFFIVDLEIAGSMNPFLRMDGYWLMADLFGIVNLRQQSLAVLKSALLKLTRPLLGSRTEIPALKLSRTASIALITYVVLGSAFFLYLYKIMLSQVIYYLIPAYPHALSAFWESLRASPTSLILILSNLLEVLWRSLVLLGLAIFTYRALLMLWKGLQSASRFLASRLLGKLHLRGEDLA